MIVCPVKLGFADYDAASERSRDLIDELLTPIVGDAHQCSGVGFLLVGRGSASVQAEHGAVCQHLIEEHRASLVPPIGGPLELIVIGRDFMDPVYEYPVALREIIGKALSCRNQDVVESGGPNHRPAIMVGESPEVRQEEGHPAGVWMSSDAETLHIVKERPNLGDGFVVVNRSC